MTERDLYDAALIEINKLEAPSMLLEDYNYFINKAIQQYINKVYNRYEINQQATDDLGALKKTSELTIFKLKTKRIPNEEFYFFSLMPEDYMHILNCVVRFSQIEKPDYICDKDRDREVVSHLASKLTSDIYPSIINNAYFKPSYKHPYYTFSKITEYDIDLEIKSKDQLEITQVPIKGVDPKWRGGDVINIRCGACGKYNPTSIFIDYIKMPKKIELKEDDLYGDDLTDKLEFPDYVCYEIINEFVKLLLENTSDPRLQTNVPINQTIIPQTSE